MKKNLWMLGVAVAALASCTQNEVLEVSNEKAISFDSFVEKSARATYDITKDDLTSFWVFGDKYVLGQTKGNYEDRLFNNELVSKGTDGAWTYASPIRYWQSGKTYRFAAYSDANNLISHDESATTHIAYESMTTTGDDGKDVFDKILINNYTVSDRDLLLSLHGDINTDVAFPTSVELTFKHALAKVVIEFQSDADFEQSKLRISDVMINQAYKTGDCVYIYSANNENPSRPTWSAAADVDPTTYADSEDKKFLVRKTANSVEWYVLPQTFPKDEKDMPYLTFKYATYSKEYGDSDILLDNPEDEAGLDPIHVNDYRVTLDTQKTTTFSRWLAGYVYKYKIRYNASSTEEKPIIFTLSEVGVETWKDGFNTDHFVEPTVK